MQSMHPERGGTNRAASAYLALALLGLLPILALGLIAFRTAAEEIRHLVERSNVAAATMTAELAGREIEHAVDSARAFTLRPEVRRLVADGDEEGVRTSLEGMVLAHPRVVRAFVADPEGLLWTDYPRAPESLGRNFAHRDWYRGVVDSGGVYVSEVYRRHAEPRPLLVGIAAPVHDDAGTMRGIFVHQILLEGLTEIMQQVRVGRSGHVFLLDHTGRVAAHPKLDLQAREHDEYKTIPLLAEVRRTGRPATGVYDDPAAAEPMLATARPVPVAGNTWTVVAQQPRAEAYGAVGRLGMRIGLAGGLLALGALGGVVGLVRSRRRIDELNRTLATRNRTLEEMSARLEEANRKLAERVETQSRTAEGLLRSQDALTERVEQTTAELRDREEQLRQSQKMEAIGQLAGGIAHDFNNLLSVIVGFSEMLESEFDEEDPRRRKIRQIREAGDRAAALTRQLLAFSRKQVLQPRIVDLGKVVRGMESLLRRLIGEDIELAFKCREDLDPVKTDPAQIEQVILNLAVNARDAMPGGGKLTIETGNVTLDEEYVRHHAEAKPGPHVMLAVSDTGTGMDAATRDRIFEPFFTTKETGKGTGLGLSTVFGIVKQSGGNIWVYSEPGKGTTFKVYLPRAEGKAERAGAAARPSAIPRGNETILLAEDEPAVREILEEVLASSGYRVVTAATPEEVLRIGREREGIDLLLTDVVMPGMGGRELAESLTADRPGIRVLYMSGYTDNAIVHHGVLDEGTAFLQKPIRPRDLLIKIREVLDG